jgi:hypothetical protein
MSADELTREQRRILADAEAISHDLHEEDPSTRDAADRYRDEIIAREDKRLDSRLKAALQKHAEDEGKRQQSWWRRLFK